MILRKVYKLIILSKVFLSHLFFNKKIKVVDQNLILISQIQRSGGSLLVQLFDNHEEIHAYPHELVFSNPKWNWDKELCFSTIKMNTHLKDMFYNRNFYKLSESEPEFLTNNYFNFNPFLEKKIYKKLLNYNNNDLRLKFNSYFTAFFNSFLNYSNTYSNKKYVTSFLPRFIMFEKNAEIFFETYPKGFLISILRDPKTWYLSAIKHSKAYRDDPKDSLDKWLNSVKMSIKLKQKYNNIILVSFKSLILNTEETMKYICSIIDINFNINLLNPTFNGELIDSDSSFNSVLGKVDKNVLKSKDNNFLTDNENKILIDYIKEYKVLLNHFK